MNIKIIVATHKKYWMPDDGIYLPLHVGAEGKLDESGAPLDLGYQRDNTGDNISCKNQNYCELTGLYWAWKNLDADYIGIAHYRRHFTLRPGLGDKKEKPVTGAELEHILSEHDVILPTKRSYYIETNHDQYVHAHHDQDLDITREIIQEKYPEYIPKYDECMARTKGHKFNMFIMRNDLFCRYSKWLFDILFELENRIDITGYTANDSRVYGFVSELLLDPWVETNGLDYAEVPYVFMEKQNWLIKGGNFIRRKLGI